MILALVAWFASRDRSNDSARAPGKTGSGTLTAPPRAATSAPAAPALVDAGPTEPGERPALPATPDAAPPTALELFSAEPRDERWAPRTEAELRKRLRPIAAIASDDIECRSRQCRISITGTKDAVGDAISDLEGPRGLHGYAEHVVLTAPERRADGTVVLRAFVQFAEREDR